MSSVRKKVLIISCDFRKAYPVVESLRKLGFNILAGIINYNILFTEALSRYVNNIIRIANPYSSEEAYIVSVIKAVKMYDIDIIVPIGFIDFMTLSKYKSVLEDYVTVPVEDYEKMRYVSNKWALQNFARKMKILYPKTLLLKSGVDNIVINKFVDDAGLPLVIKGLGDSSKPLLVSNREVLTDMICKLKEDVLLQEFIPGFGTGYFCLSYNGEPLAEFMHKRIQEVKPLGGASVKACSYFDENLLELGRRIIKGLKWTGVIMLEFKKEVERGSYYLLEINPKFWGSLELAYRAGIDFPKYLVEFFLEGKRPQKISYKNTCFSWFSEGFLSYSNYGFKTLSEIALNILPRNPLMSDLHFHDPVNSMQKMTIIGFSILRSLSVKSKIPKYYFNKEFINTVPYIKKIIFDFDGTLVMLVVPWNIVRSKLIGLRLIKDTESIQEAFYKYKISDDKTGFDSMNEIVQFYELNAVKNIVQDNQLLGLVKDLSRLNIKIAIVSKNSKNAVTEAVKRLGLSDYVETVIGREDAVLRFEQIIKVLGEIEPSKVIMIGDTLSDIKAALHLGIVPCMIVNSNIKMIQCKELNISYAKSVKKILRYIISQKTTR